MKMKWFLIAGGLLTFAWVTSQGTPTPTSTTAPTMTERDREVWECVNSEKYLPQGEALRFCERGGDSWQTPAPVYIVPPR